MQHRQHTKDKIPQPSSQSQEVFIKAVFCPQLCIISIQKKLLKILERRKGKKIGGQTIDRIMFPDDTAILSNSKQELEELIKELMEKGREFRLEINFSKAKITKVSRTGEKETSLFIEGKELKV